MAEPNLHLLEIWTPEECASRGINLPEGATHVNVYSSASPSPEVASQMELCDVCGKPLVFPKDDDPEFAGKTSVTSECRHAITEYPRMSEVGSMETGKADLCPKCKGTNNSRDLGGNDKCFHCGECGYARCVEICPDPFASTPPSPDKWDALRKAAEAATPGPWKVDRRASTRIIDDADATISSGGLASRDFEGAQRNAAYIAAANPTAILELLSELRGMERGGEGLQDYWRCFHCDFATYNHAEAEAHFGDRDDAEEFKPLWKWWQLMDEDERIDTLQDTIMQLNKANSAEVAVCPKCHRPHYNMEDSAACRATLSVTEGVDGWIDCKQELPPTEDSVLTFGHTEKATQSVVNEWRPEVARYLSGKYWTNSHIYVTHWMPLPKPPQSGVDGREK